MRAAHRECYCPPQGGALLLGPAQPAPSATQPPPWQFSCSPSTAPPEATGGKVVSLAGGYFGVQLPADGAYVLLALDLDSEQGWVTWTENQDGERCCDAAEEVIGPCPLGQLRSRALEAVAKHVHD